ncbi:MAG: DEAD/DEAH box helicase family protein [Candidatus Thorarchaeota archaeon]|nr:DEAD/DEAH box helicase family protein [Candidatus Thorarchaeota archaeon]
MSGRPHLEFTKKWRSYQKRILDELQSHLDDDRLHIVAAPGSGKTILGLEVVSRFNRPTLVLAPTIAIRDQWVQRLVEYFLPAGSTVPPWVSKDIRNPRFFTVSTYQALHSAYNMGEDEDVDEDEDTVLNEDADDASDLGIVNVLGQTQASKPVIPMVVNDLVEALQNAGIGTLVLDEAHHLRSSWWKSLTSVIDRLANIKIIALTATPPYDVPEFEWQRYIDLCGPVDAEVPVPELVAEGDLCPHQDLVVLSTPSKEENKEIKKFRGEVKEFVERLYMNESFLQYLYSHNWVLNPELYEEEILNQPSFYSSILIFLNHKKIKLPKQAVRLVAGSVKSIPALNLEWLEILLTGLLFPPGVQRPNLPITLEEIRDHLRKIGAIERRRISLRKNKRIEKLLKQSLSKMVNVVDIVRIEYGSLGNQLRMVILTDYIRKESLPRTSDDETPLNKIGVAPIFEIIRRAKIQGLQLGVLSGSLVIIPASAADSIRDHAYKMGIDPHGLRLRALPFSTEYLEVQLTGSDRDLVVRLITEVFNSGAIQVLVGTKSLLGEGWDAPSINSLVIASFVGSYMLSNQMRGRAIRTQHGNPDKTSNIWHLVCVETGADSAGEDYELMERRFRAFVGISFIEPVIENGFTRLGIPRAPIKKKEIKKSNERMFERARNRAEVREEWEAALHRGDEGVRLVEDVRFHRLHLPRGFVFYNTVAALFWEGVFWGLFTFTEYLRGLVKLAIYEQFWFAFGIGLIITAIVMLPHVIKALLLFVRHGPIKSSLSQVGMALLKTLRFMGEIRTDIGSLRVVVEEIEGMPGYVYCHLEGGSNREK